MDLTIRRFEERDRGEVVSLWDRCGLIVPWNNPELDIDRKVGFQPDLFLVGEAGGRVAATAMGGYEGHRGWVNYLAVDPGLRGRGFGRALMARMESELSGLGCPKINIQVRRDNLDVMRFYERIGYVDDDLVSLGKRLKEDPPWKGGI